MTDIRFKLNVKWIQIGLYGLLTYFTFLMLLITLQYIPVDFDVAFLRIKQDVVNFGYYRVAFFTHVYASMFALLPGFIQFSDRIRQRHRNLHKTSGYIYVFTILLFSAPTGFVMGYHANGGWTSSLAFMLLSVLWFYFTIKALTKAMDGDLRAHRRFMWRSYALTLSAISLRLWKWILVLMFEPAPMDVYRAVAWLGWVGNLLVVEWWLRRK